MLTIIAATALAAAAAGYLAARASRSRAPDGPRTQARGGGGNDGSAGGSSGTSGKRGGASTPTSEVSVLEGLPLALGDVVVGQAEERWLAGALVAREKGRVVAVLFCSPEGALTHAVAAFAEPRREIFWMSPVQVDSPAEPPATIEIHGAMLERRGRIPVAIERLGQGAPHIGDAAIWATYEGGGKEIAVLLTSGGKVHAWSGKRLDPDEYDRMGSGGTD